MGKRLLSKVLERFLGLSKDLFLPADQSPAKILSLAFIHERLVIRRPVVRRQYNAHDPISPYSRKQQNAAEYMVQPATQQQPILPGK
jgi:hypothetical protein